VKQKLDHHEKNRMNVHKVIHIYKSHNDHFIHVVIIIIIIIIINLIVAGVVRTMRYPPRRMEQGSQETLTHLDTGLFKSNKVIIIAFMITTPNYVKTYDQWVRRTSEWCSKPVKPYIVLSSVGMFADRKSFDDVDNDLQLLAEWSIKYGGIEYEFDDKVTYLGTAEQVKKKEIPVVLVTLTTPGAQYHWNMFHKKHGKLSVTDDCCQLNPKVNAHVPIHLLRDEEKLINMIRDLENEKKTSKYKSKCDAIYRQIDDEAIAKLPKGGVSSHYVAKVAETNNPFLGYYADSDHIFDEMIGIS
jgi:hypothetical protein